VIRRLDVTSTAFRQCTLCEAHCGIRVDVEGDEVVRITGDLDDVMSQGISAWRPLPSPIYERIPTRRSPSPPTACGDPRKASAGDARRALVVASARLRTASGARRLWFRPVRAPAGGRRAPRPDPSACKKRACARCSVLATGGLAPHWRLSSARRRIQGAARARADQPSYYARGSSWSVEPPAHLRAAHSDHGPDVGSPLKAEPRSETEADVRGSRA
jgi:hypothetical protein